jgi:L-alanine-DL-glutamate epimerase-like enolase superfamily enzyme
MIIDQIETTVLEMPYKKPLVTATNNFTVARGLLVKVVTDAGVAGYGYSDLFPRTGETPETARHTIEEILKPKVVGRELEELVRIRADIDHTLTGNPRAKAALETAMYDALARSYHIPLFLMLGGRYRKEIKVIKMVSVDAPEAMAEEAKRLVREGLSLKLKVSGKIDQDLPRVAAVRKAVAMTCSSKSTPMRLMTPRPQFDWPRASRIMVWKFSSSPYRATNSMRCGKSKNIRRSRSKPTNRCALSGTRKW